MSSGRRRFGELERLALIFAVALFGSLIAPRLVDLASNDAAVEEASIDGATAAEATPAEAPDGDAADEDPPDAETAGDDPPALAIDPDDLDSLSDEQLDEAVLDLIYEAIGDDWERKDEILAALPPAYMAFFTMSLIEEDVRYAGLNEAAYWPDDYLVSAIDGYRLVGAETHATLVEAAMELYWEEDEAWDDCRHDPDCDVTDYLAWNRLDVRWFEAEAAGEDPVALRAAYVRAHPDVFAVECFDPGPGSTLAVPRALSVCADPASA